jgi:hypothetical protein
VFTHLTNLGADDDALAASGLGLIGDLVLRGAVVGFVGERATGTTAVKLDAVTSTGDTIAFTGAAGATRADAGGLGAVGRAAGEGWDIRAFVGVILGLGGVVDALLGKLAVEGLKGGLIELGVDDLAGLTWALGLGGSNAFWGESTALGDRSALSLAARALLRLAGGDVKDVELAASGGLGGVVTSGVVGDVVTIDDVVVPVAGALLQGSTLEFERASPATGLLGVLGKGKLTLIAVPGAEQVHGLAVGGSAEGEVELDSGHCDVIALLLFKIE